MKKQILILTTAILSLTAFAQVPSYVPANGLVGYWPFNGNANDESGNGNNGTVNGATLTADRNGIVNASFSFNGSNILIPLTQQMVSMSSRTISLWFNSANGQSGGRLFEATNFSWGAGCYNSNVFDCWYQKSDQAYNFVGESFQNNNQWHNLVFVCDSSAQSKKLYLNGILINSSIPVSNPGNPISWQNHFLKIGQGNANESFIGSIDDIGIWNRALSQCEIQNLYASQLNSTSVSAGIDESICNGEQVILTASGSHNYSWNNGVVDGAPFSPTNTLDYIVTADSAGCQSADTLTVFVNQPTNSTLNETALDSLSLNGQTYTQSGTYTQIIPNAAGCDSTITLNLSLDFTGLQELENSFTISPNPAKDQLNVLSPSGISENYFLLDGQGRKVLAGKLTGTKTIIDISKLAAGNYLVQVGEEQMPVRIVKN